MDTCFYFLIVDYNKSAMNIFGQIFVGISLFLLSKYVGVEFLGHSGKYIFNFLRNCQTFFHFTTKNVIEFQLPAVSVVRLIKFSCSGE